MRFLLKFGLILTIILIATAIIIPPAYQLTFPRQPGPIMDPSLRITHLEHIEANQPQIILLGDSTLNNGIDPEALAQQTGKSVYNMGTPGSASALWYLLLKNNIIDAKVKPQYVLVIFRDTILTAPGYRVQGSYFEVIDEYAQRNEPILIEKSFTNLMSPLELTADKYLPIYVTRSQIRRSIDAHIRYFAPPMVGCDRTCVDYALGELFLAANLEPGALVNAVGAAESYLYTPDQLDFEAQVDRSYLPDMISLAKENDINLVFVRIKVETTSAEDAAELDAYFNGLRTYLKSQDISLLDYGEDPRLTHEYFQDVIHLNEEGKTLFTQMVAEGLNELINQK